MLRFCRSWTVNVEMDWVDVSKEGTTLEPETMLLKGTLDLDGCTNPERVHTRIGN
jgi:hypothetical protein